MALTLIVFLSCSAQAEVSCFSALSIKDYYRKTSRIFAILSLAFLPVQDTRITVDPPSQQQQLEPWEATPAQQLVRAEYSRLQRAAARELAKAQPNYERLEELRQEIDLMKRDFPGLN